MKYSEQNDSETEPKMPSQKSALDELDLLIIRELHADARASASEIARKTNANERTIRKRIERLVSEGAIRLTVILDRLMAISEITYVALGQETKEISIAARFRDNEALREFLGHTLPGIPGITVTGYALVPRILRNIDEWMPKEEDFNIP
jgi:Lrp/AsnC family transcriptional regulator for asnA, asnC and gidA